MPGRCCQAWVFVGSTLFLLLPLLKVLLLPFDPTSTALLAFFVAILSGISALSRGGGRRSCSHFAVKQAPLKLHLRGIAYLHYHRIVHRHWDARPLEPKALDESKKAQKTDP